MGPRVGQPVHGRAARQAARRVGRRFSDRHPDAVVLHLGCGLDSRVFRLDPPATVQWFDVDQPDVIELRRKLYSDRDGYQMIASSVTDPAWLESIPADRPVLVVAEGLLMYSPRPKRGSCCSASPTGSAPASCWRPAVTVGSAHLQAHRVGTRRRLRLADWNPRLRYIEQKSAIGDFEKIPLKPQRAVFRMLHGIPGTPRLRPALPLRF